MKNIAFLLLCLFASTVSVYAQDSQAAEDPEIKRYEAMDKFTQRQELEKLRKKTEQYSEDLEKLEDVLEKINEYVVKLNSFNKVNSVSDQMLKDFLSDSANFEYGAFSMIGPNFNVKKSFEEITLPSSIYAGSFFEEGEDMEYYSEITSQYNSFISDVSSELKKITPKMPKNDEEKTKTAFKEKVSTLLDKYKRAIPSVIDKINVAKIKLNTKLQREEKRINFLFKELSEDENINSQAINLGLPLFCITIFLLFVSPSIVRYFRMKIQNPSHTSDANDRHSQNVLLEISTVLLVTMSILILGLSDKIDGQVLGTLLGGISGYVLNRVRQPVRNNNEQGKEKK